jgi:hypothetical protein
MKQSAHSPILIQHSTGIPATAIKQEEEIKGTLIDKETVKIYLFADDMILYLKGPKNCTHKPLDMIKSIRKVAEYKIHLTKIISFSIHQKQTN